MLVHFNKALLSFILFKSSLPVSFIGGLKFIKKPSNVTGFVSKPLWIDCTGSGYPKPAIHYFRIKDRAGALDSTHFKEYDNGTLYIASVKTEDQGTYMCFLKSKPGGTKTAQFRLTVQSKTFNYVQLSPS